VGIGNWMFPRSRSSVGLYIVDKYAEKLGLKWMLHEKIYSFIAETPQLLLVFSDFENLRFVSLHLLSIFSFL
jgi:peptidyl-tRNA hydrolase